MRPLLVKYDRGLATGLLFEIPIESHPTLIALAKKFGNDHTDIALYPLFYIDLPGSFVIRKGNYTVIRPATDQEIAQVITSNKHDTQYQLINYLTR